MRCWRRWRRGACRLSVKTTLWCLVIVLFLHLLGLMVNVGEHEAERPLPGNPPIVATVIHEGIPRAASIIQTNTSLITNETTSRRKVVGDNLVEIIPGLRKDYIDPNVSIHFKPIEPAPSRVIYNRLTKTGSRSIYTVLAKVGKKNNVYCLASTDYVNVQFSDVIMDSFRREISKMRTPGLYNRHMYHADMQRLEITNTIYINLVRDPVERYLSNFYFSKSLGQFPPKVEAMSFEDCMREQLHWCYTERKLAETTLYFCGQNTTECQVPLGGDHSAAIALAKRHIVRDYAVVGLMEDMEGFMGVLEYILPTFFKGVSWEYNRSKDAGRARTKTKNKGKVTKESRALLSKPLASDQEIYRFIKQRFYTQKRLVDEDWARVQGKNSEEFKKILKMSPD